MVIFERPHFWGRSPLTIVEAIIAIASVIGGIYVISPLITYSALINGASPLIATLTNPWLLLLYGVILLVAGLLVLAGIVRRKYRWRSVGLFMIILIRTYGLIVTLLVQGLLPLTWLSSLVVLLTCVICYVVVRAFVLAGDK